MLHILLFGAPICLHIIQLLCLCVHQLLHLLNLFFGCQKLHWHILVLSNPLLVWLILPIVVARKVFNQVFLLAICSADLALWHLLPTIVFDERLKLLYPEVFELNVLLGLPVDPIVGIEFLLQLDDGLISFVQSASKSDHDVPLLQE